MVSSPLLRDKPSAPKAATQCPEAADLSVRQLTAMVTSPLARCFGSTNPDDWFPVAARADQVRVEAARALQLCAAWKTGYRCYRNASAAQAQAGLQDRRRKSNIYSYRSFSSCQPLGSGW